MTEVDFPILGTEPLPVEFANTDYGGGAERIDFLRSAEQIDRWFAVVHPPAIEGEMGAPVSGCGSCGTVCVTS